jgi:hypothetical protein
MGASRNSNHRHDEPCSKTVLGFGAAGASITFYTPEKKDATKVNAWILSSEEFDGVVDLDAVVRDPSHPRNCSRITQWRPPASQQCRLPRRGAIPLALFQSH